MKRNRMRSNGLDWAGQALIVSFISFHSFGMSLLQEEFVPIEEANSFLKVLYISFQYIPFQVLNYISKCDFLRGKDLKRQVRLDCHYQGLEV